MSTAKSAAIVAPTLGIMRFISAAVEGIGKVEPVVDVLAGLRNGQEFPILQRDLQKSSTNKYLYGPKNRGDTCRVDPVRRLATCNRPRFLLTLYNLTDEESQLL